LALALDYIQELAATFVHPSAGPPCFLDDYLFNFNDFDRNPTNTFPDQTVFLEYLQEHGLNNGRLMIPGSVATLSKSACNVKHPLSGEQVEAIFREKRTYLEAYKARQEPRINAIKASWPRNQIDILSSLRAWFEPLLEQADLQVFRAIDNIAIGGKPPVGDAQHQLRAHHPLEVDAVDDAFDCRQHLAGEFHFAHAEGAASIKSMSGLKLLEEEKVAETLDVQKTMQSMIELDGATLLFPTSFGYFDPHMLREQTELVWEALRASSSLELRANVGATIARMNGMMPSLYTIIPRRSPSSDPIWSMASVGAMTGMSTAERSSRR